MTAAVFFQGRETGSTQMNNAEDISKLLDRLRSLAGDNHINELQERLMQYDHADIASAEE